MTTTNLLTNPQLLPYLIHEKPNNCTKLDIRKLNGTMKNTKKKKNSYTYI